MFAVLAGDRGAGAGNDAGSGGVGQPDVIFCVIPEHLGLYTNLQIPKNLIAI